MSEEPWEKVMVELLEACKAMLVAFADDDKAIDAMAKGFAAVVKAEGVLRPTPKG